MINVPATTQLYALACSYIQCIVGPSIFSAHFSTLTVKPVLNISGNKIKSVFSFRPDKRRDKLFKFFSTFSQNKYALNIVIFIGSISAMRHLTFFYMLISRQITKNSKVLSILKRKPY